MVEVKRLLLCSFLIFVILFSTKIIPALSVTPGKVSMNFQPGLETEILYSTSSGNPDRELEIFVEGDLAEYIKVNKKRLIGRGEFIATIKLPKSLEKPGPHKTAIWIREKIDEELVGTAVRTSVNIGALIVVSVPYPGKYIEVDLHSHNVNFGDPVVFFLTATSKGSEIVNISPRIDVTSKDNPDELFDTLYLQEREVKSQEVLKLKKELDTSNLNPGRYRALAVVEYAGKIASAGSDFRIGELVIEILDYTKKITIGKIMAFDIEIESGWNDKIDGVYADVSIFNDSNLLPMVSFKTSTTELSPWEKKTITGHFDSSDFTKGVYDANITLIYFGKERGRTTSETVKVEFVDESNLIKTVLITGGFITLAIIIFRVIRRYFFKTKNKKGR